MNFSFEQIMNSSTIEELKTRLRGSACDRCSLCQHDSSVVVSRGASNASIMLVGEGPGLGEDIEGYPFVGPAGKLLDKVMAAIGVDTNRDCYLTNVVKCRPVAPEGCGKQNYTPMAKQCRTCVLYLLKEIELLRPKIIVSIGLTPVKYLYNLPDYKMGAVAGRLVCPAREEIQGTLCFSLYHTAYILHSQKKGNEEVLRVKNLMWNDVKVLREIIRNEGIETSL